MDTRAESNTSGRRSESPLFHTPPPWDTLVDLTHSVDSNVISPSGPPVLRSIKRSHLRGTTSNQKKTRQPQNSIKKRNSESSNSEASTIKASLTLMEAPPAEVATQARGDFPTDHSPKAHSPVPVTPGKGQVPLVSSSSNLYRICPSLRQLTGYESSEDEDAHNNLDQSDKNHITPLQVYILQSRSAHKSSEYTVNDTSSGAKARRGSGKQSLINTMPKAHEGGQDRAFERTNSMNENKVGAPWPKGTHKSVAPKNRKAPKTKGGFVMSDESDTEDLQANVEDKRDCHPPTTISTSHTVDLPKPRPSASTEKRSMNGKQLNKNRLSKLLGRHKSPFVQRPPKADSSSTSNVKSSSPPASKPRPTTPGSRSHGVQNGVDQHSVFGTLLASSKVCDKVDARNPLQSVLPLTRTGSSLPPSQTKQLMSRGETTMSPVPSTLPSSPDITFSQRAEQPLRHSHDPSSVAGKDKSSIWRSSQEHALENGNHGDKPEPKLGNHKIASKPPVPGPQSGQKRKVEEMVPDLDGSSAVSKKRSARPATSVGRPDNSDRSKEVAQVSTLVPDNDRTPPVSLVIDAPIASSWTPAANSVSVPIIEASLQPDVQNVDAIPVATVANSAKDKQVFSDLLPAPPEDCTTSKSTPRVELHNNLVPKSVCPDIMIGKSTDQQQGLSPQPLYTTPNIDTNFQGYTQHSVSEIQVIELPPMIPSANAEPYFEYSIFERRWADDQDEYDVKGIGVISRPFIDLNEANKQVEQLFQRMREESTWHTQDTLADWTSKRDEYGCLICKASFAHFDNPYQEHFIKIWVQRDYVSKLANQTPWEPKRKSFISSTVFVLRLFKIVTPSEGSESEGSVEQPCSPMRIHQPLIRSEVYTTLHTANRAARDQQLEISHEKNAKNLLTQKWQEQNLKDLEEKLRTLNSTKDEEEACWKSKFNGYGIGGDQYELVVEKAGICGPRNL
ncbi:hypothetical protein IAQ61_007176 [Plenodomus lingam]|uniref:uncharacterized protein n=1 Tax=Leptosphaeria maculans TaxID=5022 RepID=UPI0033313C71|nr:hypothetical protein IAQ61_007176 [Plenodomus lingam]